MPETRRITASISCPKCKYLVKPFIVKVKDAVVNLMCPRDECKHEFKIDKGMK